MRFYLVNQPLLNSVFIAEPKDISNWQYIWISSSPSPSPFPLLLLSHHSLNFTDNMVKNIVEKKVEAIVIKFWRGRSHYSDLKLQLPVGSREEKVSVVTKAGFLGHVTWHVRHYSGENSFSQVDRLGGGMRKGVWGQRAEWGENARHASRVRQSLMNGEQQEQAEQRS